MTFPLTGLFLPCLVLVALRMLTCFLSHSLISHVCGASLHLKVMPLRRVQKAGEVSERRKKKRRSKLTPDCRESLLRCVISSESRTAAPHCRQPLTDTGCVMNIAATSSMHSANSAGHVEASTRQPTDTVAAASWFNTRHNIQKVGTKAELLTSPCSWRNQSALIG